MNDFVIALLVAEAVSLLVIGIVTAGNALDGFGHTLLWWSVAWAAVMMIMLYKITDANQVSWAPFNALVISIGNFTLFYLALRIELKFGRKPSNCSA